MSIADWINDNVPGGMSSRLGQLLDVAYNLEYGAECICRARRTCSTSSATPARGTCGSSVSRTRSTTCAGATTRLPRGCRARRPDHDERGADRDQPRRRRHLLAEFSSGPVVTADRVVMAIPFTILRTLNFSKAGFSPRKVTAIGELGTGTNSKLHVQFFSRHWNGLDCNGETFSDSGYQNTWEVTRGQAGASGILVDYTGGNIGNSFGRDGDVAPQQFLAQIEPVLPGLRDVERPRDDRLLGRQPLAQRFLLLLEGRPVHGVRRRRAPAGGLLPLRRRAHLDRLQGYLNGAVETGHRAAGEVITALGRR